jgi:thioredoxin 1
MAKLINVDQNNFAEVVLKSKIPVLVDFGAHWCAPCRAIAPVIDQLAEGYDGRVNVAAVNVDENPQLAAKYNIMSIPSVMIFNQGKVVQQLVGFKPKSEFKRVLDNLLKNK